MYPQGVCRIRKPACAGNGCAIFPTFNTAQLGKKIRCESRRRFIQRFPYFCYAFAQQKYADKGRRSPPLVFFDQSMLS